MHKKYVLECDLSDSRVFTDKRRTWDSVAALKGHIHVDLERQHGVTNMFKGPIHIVCNFYLLYPKDIPHVRRFDNRYHIRRPTMSCLIYFLERIATGIIFGNCVTIASMTCNKIFTLDNPRVELEVYSLKGKE